MCEPLLLARLFYCSEKKNSATRTCSRFRTTERRRLNVITIRRDSASPPERVTLDKPEIFCHAFWRRISAFQFRL